MKTITPIIKAKSDVLNFGKYKGKDVEHVLLLDPDYILWLKDHKICRVRKYIYDKATSLSAEKFNRQFRRIILNSMRYE